MKTLSVGEAPLHSTSTPSVSLPLNPRVSSVTLPSLPTTRATPRMMGSLSYSTFPAGTLTTSTWDAPRLMRSDTGSGSTTPSWVDAPLQVTSSMILPLRLSPPLAALLDAIPALTILVLIVSRLLHLHSRNPVAHNSSFPAIHNYMDYSDDSCLNNFTPGQIVRLRDQIAAFRGIPRA
jgi:hypothetical protein